MKYLIVLALLLLIGCQAKPPTYSVLLPRYESIYRWECTPINDGWCIAYLVRKD